MDNQTYLVWSKLHIRTAKKETLTKDEQDLYAAGLAELESEETEELGLKELQFSRDRLEKVRANYLIMHDKYDELEAQRIMLESKLQQKNRNLTHSGSR